MSGFLDKLLGKGDAPAAATPDAALQAILKEHPRLFVGPDGKFATKEFAKTAAALEKDPAFVQKALALFPDAGKAEGAAEAKAEGAEGSAEAAAEEKGGAAAPEPPLPDDASWFAKLWHRFRVFIGATSAPVLEMVLLGMLVVMFLIWYVVIHMSFLYAARLRAASETGKAEFSQILNNDGQYQTLSSLYFKSRYPYWIVLVLLGVAALIGVLCAVFYLVLRIKHGAGELVMFADKSLPQLAAAAFLVYVFGAFATTAALYAVTYRDVQRSAGKERGEYEAVLAAHVSTDAGFLRLLQALPTANVKINPFVQATSPQKVDGLAYADDEAAVPAVANAIFTYRLYMYLMHNVAAYDYESRAGIKSAFGSADVFMTKLLALARRDVQKNYSNFMTRKQLFLGDTDYSSLEFLTKNVKCTDQDTCGGKLPLTEYYRKYRAAINGELNAIHDQLRATADVAAPLSYAYGRCMRMSNVLTIVNGYVPLAILGMLAYVVKRGAPTERLQWLLGGGMGALAGAVVVLRWLYY